VNAVPPRTAVIFSALSQSAIDHGDEIDLIVQLADHFAVMSANDAGTHQREPELVAAQGIPHPYRISQRAMCP